MKNLWANKSTVMNGATLSAAIAVGVVFTFGLPAEARFDYTNWQPQVGILHTTENNLEKQINRDYKAGLIDTNEMAQMRRDLDGIVDQEDEFRVDHNGLSYSDEQCLARKLACFQHDLDRATSDKFMPVFVVAVEK